jgi:hypothetical protein
MTIVTGFLSPVAFCGRQGILIVWCKYQQINNLAERPETGVQMALKLPIEGSGWCRGALAS